MVTRDRGVVEDNAIVRFDGGATLGKFQFRENSTKVYIPQGGKDYAIVNSEARGEMPIGFKAAENGTYTVSVDLANAGELGYLHLIDNLTGADVNLLQTPSYTFDARKTDYASRFRLVFSDGSDAIGDNGSFVFFNGSDWVVSCKERSTLQIVDMMGRVLYSAVCPGNAHTVSTQGFPAGVYVFRLVGGAHVKVQKAVIE